MFLKVMLTGFAVATLALAQGGGMSGGGRGEKDAAPPGGGLGMKVPKKSKGEMIAERLKLNKEQTSEVETLLNSTAKEANPLIQQISQSRASYVSALVDGKGDAELEPLTKAMFEAQFAMTGVEVRAFQKIVEMLKPNQLAKAPEAFDLMAGIFIPQSSGGGGGRMGRSGNR